MLFTSLPRQDLISFCRNDPPQINSPTKAIERKQSKQETRHRRNSGPDVERPRNIADFNNILARIHPDGLPKNLRIKYLPRLAIDGSHPSWVIRIGDEKPSISIGVYPQGVVR